MAEWELHGVILLETYSIRVKKKDKDKCKNFNRVKCKLTAKNAGSRINKGFFSAKRSI